MLLLCTGLWILIGLLISLNFGFSPMMLYYLGGLVGLVGIIFKDFNDEDFGGK